MADARKFVTHLTAHINKMTILLGDLSTEKTDSKYYYTQGLEGIFRTANKILTGKCTNFETSYIRGK